MCDENAVREGVGRIEREFGPVDALIGNAGIHRRGLLADMPLDAWRNVIDTNLTAAFIVSKAVAKPMIERSHGKIVFITSLMAEGARPSTGNYCAAKGGLKMLTKALAAELGSRPRVRCLGEEEGAFGALGRPGGADRPLIYEGPRNGEGGRINVGDKVVVEPLLYRIISMLLCSAYLYTFYFRCLLSTI